MELHKIAQTVRDLFVTHKRSDGDIIMVAKETSDEGATKNLVYDTTDGIEIDLAYELVTEALDAIADGECETADDVLEIEFDGDVYNVDLLKWFTSNWGEVDEVIREFGSFEACGGDIMAVIRTAQSEQRYRVAIAVAQYLEEHYEEFEVVVAALEAEDAD